MIITLKLGQEPAFEFWGSSGKICVLPLHNGAACRRQKEQSQRPVPLRAGFRSLPWPQMHGTQRLSWRRYLGAGSVCGIWPCLRSEKQVAPLKGSRIWGSLASSHSPGAVFPFCLPRPGLLFLQTAILHPPSCGSWKTSLCPLVFLFFFFPVSSSSLFYFFFTVEQNKRPY